MVVPGEPAPAKRFVEGATFFDFFFQFDEYRFVALGVVTLGAEAEHNLELKSQGKTWSEVRLRRVRLVPAP